MRFGLFSIKSTILLATIATHVYIGIPIGDAWFKFSGIVSDTRGNPVEGAELVIYVNGKIAGENSRAYTDSEGRYQFFESSCACA